MKLTGSRASMALLATWGVFLIACGLAVGGTGSGTAVAFGGIMLVVAIVGYVRDPGYQRESEERREGLSVLPPEYRPRQERTAFWVAAFSTTIVATVVGASDGRWASGLLALAVAVGWGTVALARMRQHRLRVISSVTRRAETMSPREVKTLIETLEAVYSPRQMRPLRQLLPSDTAH